MVRDFADKNFEKLIEINFELNPEYKTFFKQSLDPEKILKNIFLLNKKEACRGKTLIFLDEIQACPRAITALRYFYEKMPGLHVIAAGSLLDFVLGQEAISIPVGRVQYLYLEPLNFFEFLLARDHGRLIDYLNNFIIGKDKFEIAVHNLLMEEYKTYLITGGMPAVINRYLDSNSFEKVFEEQSLIIGNYKDDFKKYAKKLEEKYLRKVFDNIPGSVGKKFMYSRIDPELKSRDLKNALELLVEARVAKKVKRSSPHSLPLEALASDKFFKVLFIDCGLMQRVLGLDLSYLAQGDFTYSYLSALAEQFIGQELIQAQAPNGERALYYWARESTNSSAEIDYLIWNGRAVLPIEVKGGNKKRLKSLHQFMEEYKSPKAILFSNEPFGIDGPIINLPFYAASLVNKF